MNVSFGMLLGICWMIPLRSTYPSVRYSCIPPTRLLIAWLAFAFLWIAPTTVKTITPASGKPKKPSQNEGRLSKVINSFLKTNPIFFMAAFPA